jgi:hypothetical protein
MNGESKVNKGDFKGKKEKPKLDQKKKSHLEEED